VSGVPWPEETRPDDDDDDDDDTPLHNDDSWKRQIECMYHYVVCMIKPARPVLAMFENLSILHSSS